MSLRNRQAFDSLKNASQLKKCSAYFRIPGKKIAQSIAFYPIWRTVFTHNSHDNSVKVLDEQPELHRQSYCTNRKQAEKCLSLMCIFRFIFFTSIIEYYMIMHKTIQRGKSISAAYLLI